MQNYFSVQQKWVIKSLGILSNQVPRTIRISVLLLFCSITLLHATAVYGQEASITLHLQNRPVEEILKEIEKQTGLGFFFNNKHVRLQRLASVSVEKGGLFEALDKLFAGTNVKYKIVDQKIILSTQLDGVQQQSNSVRGKISSGAGEPIIGASIMEKGTTNGTITDLDGNFRLTVSSAQSLIQVSYIGYESQELKVQTQKPMHIVLKEDAQALDEVVVVGYGTVKKSDLTGSVGSVAMKNVSQVGITSADRALQGQVPGVAVNARTGQPGEAMMIRIRGGNSLTGGNEPLYIIDGMPVEGMTSDINPEDIASMEVLKDASSTAIYGSRGANGVVMITTKRGTSQRATVDYSGYVGLSQLRKKLELLGKDDYIAMVNEVALNDGKPLVVTPDQAVTLPDNDWQELAYRTALTQNHQLAVSGGNETTKLYASLNYLNQEGIIKGSAYNRLGIRINGDQKIAKNLSLNANVAYSYGTQQTANSSADGYGAIAYTAMVMPPIVEILNDEGEYTSFSGTPWGGTNPVGMSERYKSQTVNVKLLTNISLQYTLLEGLELRVNGGAEVNAMEYDRYIPIGLSAGGKLNGDASKRKENYYSLINENILTYNRQFNKNHLLNVMGGVTFQSYQFNRLDGSATGFLRDIYETNNLGAGAVAGTPKSNFSDYRMASFLGRINYNLLERYLFTVTGRYDGSSKFSKNHKFAFFPSAALAWRVSEERFMEALPWLNNLKLRASIGVTGNQAISAYATQARIATNSPVFGSGKEVGFQLSSMPNDDLKWETTTQTNLGVDLGFWDDRVTLTFDYYWKQTRDLLYRATLPPSSGYSSMLRNIGRIDNKGLEIGIHTVNMRGAIFWTTGLTLSANRSLVKDLGTDVQGNKIRRMDAPVAGGNWFPLFVGKAPFQLYGYEIEGLYQTDEEARQNGEATKKAGDYRYKDTDGKPGITTGDKTILSNLQPTFIFGLTNRVNWKSFEFSLLLVGSVGNDIVNEFNKSITNIGGTWNIRKEVWDNRWQEGVGGKYPRASSATKDYMAFGDPNSGWVEDGSYLRFKDVRIGYTLPAKWFSGQRKPTLSLYVSGQNLITFTNYSHYDPEASWTSSAVNGWDRGVYPSSKSYTLGVQVKF